MVNMPYVHPLGYWHNQCWVDYVIYHTSPFQTSQGYGFQEIDPHFLATWNQVALQGHSHPSLNNFIRTTLMTSDIF
mgnify:CR=1 FL=1